MSDKKFPNPEEVQKEFEDFVRQRFGQGVQIFRNHLNSDEPQADDTEEKTSSEPMELNFDLKPKEVKSYLDKYVIRQDEAKKALAIAICDHYNQVKYRLEHFDESKDRQYTKQNVLILGPTGVGKTYLIKKIAQLVGVPFVKADATRFSETGYVGANVDDLVKDLVAQADGDIEKAQYGIIYLDEADKLASSGRSIGRDVTGRGVQFGLLKLMEETEVDLNSGNDMQSQMQALLDMQKKGKVEKQVINTAHILFIVSGAFTGLADIIKKRLSPTGIGFTSPKKAVHDSDEVFPQVATSDLVDYGFEPEFIGRLPVRVACHHLDEHDLFGVLKDSADSIIHQYQQAFAAYDIKATFQDDALKAIAKKAATEKTGARALMTVCEQIFRDYKYELPSSALRHLDIDATLVNSPKATLENLLAHPDPTVIAQLTADLKEFEEQFAAHHGMTIRFDDSAIARIIDISIAEKKTVAQLLEKTLESYEHGLKLIHQVSGKDSFNFNDAMVNDPKTHLENLIRQSYQNER